MPTILIVLGVTLITIAYAFILLSKIKKLTVKNQSIKEISSYIKEGTYAFLKREYKIILIFILITALILALLGLIPALKEIDGVGIYAAISFLIGAFLSGFTGFIGMLAGVKANGLTAEDALNSGMSKALKTSFTGGAIMGLLVVSFGLFGLSSLYFIFDRFATNINAVQVVAGYGLGASFVALFARVGGGIYTKAADVGADLVGKVEASIPEDDPRNPAVIADNVGDNVGDIAGMGSDLLESYVGSLISALSLGFILVNSGGNSYYLLFPLLVATVGVLAALISVAFIRLKEWENPQLTLRIATLLAAFIVVVGAAFGSYLIFKTFKPFFAVFSGVAVGILIGYIAEYYTSDSSKAVKEVAHQSETGHATNIIAGFSVGMRSTALTIITLVLGIFFAYFMLKTYGIALAAVGMLSTVGITVSVDAYGPIADNAGGIAQMAKLPHDVRAITDKLDSVGNTTAAIGKGFCIGSATLTSLALFVAYAELAGLSSINIIEVNTIIGLLIGAMLPYLFTSLTISSVGTAANLMIEEVRRQFKEDPNILLGTSKPDYAKCVDISTKAALKEMIIPGLLALLMPFIIGFLLGPGALGGLLVGSLASASMLAVFMANSGGAWDNAKKLIESRSDNSTGTDCHKAAITGDTVGDPFKDTAGPAMDILIKLMSIISLIIAPIIIKVEPLIDLFLNLFN
ncbi:MAG: sodium-translocating pyrophosphatase [Acholeplasmatales bacterium]|jgi:K(+)-stimulated pyrophosphate-energized sodium pump|nr:sodium-translocating pyrophosphatase [Acholeplasmataceae bacterium]MCK9233928.1 sodium-translocating pyrophosphatase [Acholeplasmataceae bacterium]MCK9289232.1 sodium-translocating pyrophosphatase [Acholeplasmataceae bacterium]MCK9427662.1 sodium-translocating pyrophosphatase [Acholeplasmataceae bacterium]MDY0115297.1 sodium-translocating pyrophosphatase [Acholeplasmatales bacterium]